MAWIQMVDDYTFCVEECQRTYTLCLSDEGWRLKCTEQTEDFVHYFSEISDIERYYPIFKGLENLLEATLSNMRKH